MNNDIFRFISIRPPQQIDMSKVVTEDVHTHDSSEEESQLLNNLRKVRNLDDGRQKMESVAMLYVESAEFVSDLKLLSIPLALFDDWVAGRHQSIELIDIAKAIENVFSYSANELISKKEYQKARLQLADSLLAASITPQNLVGIRPRLIKGMRLLGLIERIATDDPSLRRRRVLQRALNAIVILPTDVFPLPSNNPQPLQMPDTDKVAKKQRRKIVTLVNELDRLKAARDEIVNAVDNDKDGSTLSNAKSSATLVSQQKPLDTIEDASVIEVDEPQVTRVFLLSNTVSQQLSEDTIKVLKQLDISVSEIDVPTAIERIGKEIAKVSSKLYTANLSRNIVRIGNTYVQSDEFYKNVSIDEKKAPRTPGPCPPTPPEQTSSSEEIIPSGARIVRPIGIADLMVVEQEIQKYEMGEIAHIENVLRGEAKERKYRRTQTTEESLFVETERTEQTERELESTERFELQQESQQVISQDTSKEVGVTVSGSYGPSIDVTLNSNFATNSSREDSKQTSSSYARDVTARAASRVQERTLQRRFQRTVEEIEEINTHTIDNRGQQDHAIGIYRWVDKIYKAQIVNYGRRLMFEFIIPEPAGFLRYALSRPSVEANLAEMPEPPGYCVDGSSQFEPLQAKDIAEDNYLFWASMYGATDVEPPPPVFKVLGEAISESNLQNGVGAKSSKEIEVPPDYVAITAYRSTPAFTANTSKAYSRLSILIGQNTIHFESDKKASPASTFELRRERNVVPVSFLAVNLKAYSINIIVLCKRTDESYQAWQFKTFNAIMTAYHEMKARYDEKLEAAQVQQGVAIRGRNPILNREIEKTELKKTCISLLTGQHFDLFNAMKRNVLPYGYPELDLEEAEIEGRYIQFFEQAFEWVNMTYIFYPYFWGQKDEWPALALLDDTDPMFGRFLQAGAARVQVPVSPGYEDAITYFRETNGNPWEGGDPPHTEDKLYRSIVAEIKEQQAADSGKSEGTISVTQGNAAVTGTDTDFDEDDVDRRITIEGQRYCIAEVGSPTSLTLAEAYRGPVNTNARYSIGVKFVGAPWEVRLPTSLVILQKDTTLPDWTKEQEINVSSQ